MARLIDADKIDYTVTMVGRDEYAGYRAVAFESDIDDMPTVDAVEVVRCKDCKHCEVFYAIKEIDKEAELSHFCKFNNEQMYPNDFCSYGKRKEQK